MAVANVAVNESLQEGDHELFHLAGPEGISFDGSADGRVDGEPVAIPPQLTFVVRRVAMSPGKATLCESVDGGNFTESIVLDVLLTRTLSGCRTHIPGTGSGMARSGMVSLPGRIVVRLLNEDTLLTPREIVVKLGSCDSNEPESSPLSVTGKSCFCSLFNSPPTHTHSHFHTYVCI